MGEDYIRVEYAEAKRPSTDYPKRLARHLASLWGIRPGMRLLDVASGRAEVAAGFVELGIEVTCLDSAESGAEYAESVGAAFVQHRMSEESLLPFEPGEFDVVYSKSFIEHITFPVDYLASAERIVGSGGTVLTLTPDWQANYKTFFDDVTHVKPFTVHTMRQAIQLSGLECISSYTFRQLPITWTNPWANGVSAVVAPFVPVRTQNKFLRWSRELMVCGVGRKR